MAGFFTEDDFLTATEVSAEVMGKLRHYHAKLLEWNPKINLVSASTLDEAWQRHFMDSAQLYPVYRHSGDQNTTLADMGSGAGFPGMVLAIMGAPNVTLIERDVRKAAFLRTIAAETKTKINLLNLDIKDVTLKFDVITSRALADLSELLEMSEHIRKPSTHCLFLKGKNLDAELVKAQKDWTMAVRKMESVTDNEAYIIRLTELKRISP
ncbi:MAG: 16S rRNA (guanine(527)-N(7))-methyltransferase RsmG [Alphaproteobacteria bacterium]|nr:16S rRNA (guanine(527)-N(7))-methyltransferase RsmG [Alphaproteobacteria bacterium]